MRRHTVISSTSGNSCDTAIDSSSSLLHSLIVLARAMVAAEGPAHR